MELWLPHINIHMITTADILLSLYFLKHTCLGFQADHNPCPCGEIDGHAWAGWYIHLLRICLVKQEPELAVHSTINFNVLHLDPADELVRTTLWSYAEFSTNRYCQLGNTLLVTIP